MTEETEETGTVNENETAKESETESMIWIDHIAVDVKYPPAIMIASGRTERMRGKNYTAGGRIPEEASMSCPMGMSGLQ